LQFLLVNLIFQYIRWNFLYSCLKGMDKLSETIKGINVVIGSDTTGLSKALSDVNKNARNIQSELKQVEKLLKLDPSNTQLVAQKQKLLADAIANSEEKLNKLRVAQEQVNEQFARGEISEGQYRAFQREVVKAEQELRRFQDDADKVQQAIAGLFDDVTTDKLIRELRAGGQAGEAAAQEIAQAFAQIDDEVDRNRRSLLLYGDTWHKMEQDAKRALGGVQDELRDTDRLMDKVKQGVAAAGVGIGGGEIAGGLDSATASAGHLRAMLGLTKEEAKEFEGIARDVYADNFGETMREAGEVTARTHQALGLVGEDLKNQTENVFRLNNVFAELGADTQSDLEAVRAITKAWEIDSQQAFDVITTGFQGGAGNAGDLLDTFQEYPAHFKAIGLSATDMLNWLSIGMENGARNTDYLADAVKEFGIRVKTDGDTAQQAIMSMFPADEANRIIAAFAQGGEAGRNAFFQVFEALNQVGSEQEKYNLGIQLMGTKFEDLTADQISSIVAAFAETKDKTVDLSGATQSLDEEYSGFMATLEGIKRSLEMSFLAPLGDAVPLITGLIDIGSKLGMTFFGLSAMGIDMTVIIGKLGTAFSVVSNILSVGFGGALSFIMSPLGIALVAIAGLAAIAYVVIKNWEPISTFFKNLWESIENIFNGAVESVKALIEDTWNGIKSTTETIWEGLKQFLVDWWPILLGILGGPVGILAGFIYKNWDGISQKTGEIWGNIKTAVVRTAGNLVNEATAKLNELWNWLAGLPKRAREWGSNIIRSFIDGITSLHVPLPHVRVGTGYRSVGPVTVPYPVFDVSWYSKGGIFTSPSIIGVGEAGTEAVLPIEKLSSLIDYNRLASAIVSALKGAQFEVSGSGGITALVLDNQDLMKLERKLQPIRQLEKARRGE